MAAGLGFKDFQTGEVLTAADVDGYLMQGVWVFASAAARTSAVTSPQEGNVSFLKDTNSLEIYDGTAWVAYGSGDITGVTAGTGISGGGTSGTVTITNSMATEITASGDIIVGTGNGTFDNLPLGSTGQVLTVDTTVSPYKVKWATPSSGGFVGCSVFNGTTGLSTQSISNNTLTALTFNNELFDTDGFHSTSTNTSRLTVPSGKAGYYQIYGTTIFDTNATGKRYLNINKNGSLLFSGGELLASSTLYISSIVGITANLAEGDYIEFIAYQNSGGALNIYTGAANGYTAFGMTFLGA